MPAEAMLRRVAGGPGCVPTPGGGYFVRSV